MKLSLDINEQSAIVNALSRLDSYEVVTSSENGVKAVRVPYKLGGAARRSVVKNISKLRDSLKSFEETRVALVKEKFPDLKDGEEAKPEKYPDIFSEFQKEFKEIVTIKEDFELLPLPGKLLYADDFPSEALVVLEQHGLITEEP